MAAVANRLPFSVSLRDQRGWKTALIFVAPALMLFTIFIVMPVIEALGTSFYNWNGLGALTPDKFVGLSNYEQLAGNRTFQRAMGNTLLIIAAALLIQLPLALALANLLARRR